MVSILKETETGAAAAALGRVQTGVDRHRDDSDWTGTKVGAIAIRADSAGVEVVGHDSGAAFTDLAVF